MTKKDLNRVVSAYHAGVSIDICIGMILDINKNRAEHYWFKHALAKDCVGIDIKMFHSECQQDIPKFLRATGEITT